MGWSGKWMDGWMDGREEGRKPTGSCGLVPLACSGHKHMGPPVVFKPCKFQWDLSMNTSPSWTRGPLPSAPPLWAGFQQVPEYRTSLGMSSSGILEGGFSANGTSTASPHKGLSQCHTGQLPRNICHYGIWESFSALSGPYSHLLQWSQPGGGRLFQRSVFPQMLYLSPGGSNCPPHVLFLYSLF